MWEFCVRSNSQNKHLVEFLSNKLFRDIKKFGGISSFVLVGDTCSLAVGCRKEISTKLTERIKLALCDVICLKMKYDFLKKNIDFGICEERIKEAFLKVFTYFDEEIERAIVMKSLFLPKTLVLESFLKFRLSCLVEKWKEMSNLTNANTSLFLKRDNLMDFLKFLILNLEPRIDCLILDLSEKLIFYESDGIKSVVLKNFSFEDQTEILSVIIENCPKILRIFSSGEEKELEKFLTNIFENRVEIIK